MIELHRSFAVKAVAGADRSVDVIASTDDIDRYGEVLLQDWDLTAYAKNPIVLWNHGRGMDDDMPIGHATDVRVEGGKLLAKLNFVDAKANPKAEQVYQGFVQGSLRSVSVGFRSKYATPQERDGRTVYVLSGNELMEISACAIPVNPASGAVERAKALDLIKSLIVPTETEDMTIPSSIAKSLNLADGAGEGEVVSEIKSLTGSVAELLSVTGTKSVAEAIGVVQAGRAAAAALPELQAKIVEAEKAAIARERADVIATLKADKKITPAMETWANTCDLAALRAFALVAPAIGALAPETPAPAPAPTGTKSWGELTNVEKHELFFSNRPLYESLRDADG